MLQTPSMFCIPSCYADAPRCTPPATPRSCTPRETEIEHLKLLLAKLRRMQFGRKSEKLTQQIEQLELRLEELQDSPTGKASQQPEQCADAASSDSVAKPARRPLPEHLSRQTQRQEPKESACPDCGGELRQLGEDVSEILRDAAKLFARCQPGNLRPPQRRVAFRHFDSSNRNMLLSQGGPKSTVAGVGVPYFTITPELKAICHDP